MYDDEIDDDEELGAFRDELSRTPAGEAPPLEAIVAKGRAKRRRRRSGLAGTGVAAAAVLAILFASVGGPAKMPSGHKVHVNLAAYSVDSNANGTVTVSMAAKQTFDPKALREALAAAGVLAVVRVGKFCRTSDQPPGFSQVVAPTALSAQPAEGTQATQGAQGSENPAQVNPAQVNPAQVNPAQVNPSSRSERTAVVISPSAMPRRAELSIGYFPDHVAMTLVATNTQMTCQIVDPANCQLPGPAAVRAIQSTGPAATTTLPGSASTTLTGTAYTGPASAPITLPAPATGTLPPSATTTAPPSPATSLPPPAATTVTSSGPAGAATTLPPGQIPTVAGPPEKGRWCQVMASAGGQPAPVGTPGATTTVPPSATTTRPGPRQPPLSEPVRLPIPRGREVKCAGGLGRTPVRTRGARTPPRSTQRGPHGPSAAAPEPPGTTPTRRAPCHARTCHQCPWRRCPR